MAKTIASLKVVSYSASCNNNLALALIGMRMQGRYQRSSVLDAHKPTDQEVRERERHSSYNGMAELALNEPHKEELF